MNFEGSTLFSALTIKVLLAPMPGMSTEQFSQYAAMFRENAWYCAIRPPPFSNRKYHAAFT